MSSCVCARATPAASLARCGLCFFVCFVCVCVRSRSLSRKWFLRDAIRVNRRGGGVQATHRRPGGDGRGKPQRRTRDVGRAAARACEYWLVLRLHDGRAARADWRRAGHGGGPRRAAAARGIPLPRVCAGAPACAYPPSRWLVDLARSCRRRRHRVRSHAHTCVHTLSPPAALPRLRAFG